MIVKVTYDDQRLDVFDTATFTAATPLGKSNMLTNFEVRFDTLGDGGLWMAAHSYPAEKMEDNDGQVPAARRRRTGRPARSRWPAETPPGSAPAAHPRCADRP